MYFLKKTFFSILIVLIIISANTNSVKAFSGVLDLALGNSTGSISGVPTTAEGVGGVLEELGFQIHEVRKAADIFNVTNYKNDPPKVDLVFTPTTPEPGEELTALANLSYFKNEPSNLYFTWFLKKAKCDNNNPECDYNWDGKVNIEDFKIEAARIIASKDFEWQEMLGKDSPDCKNSSNPSDYCTLTNQYESPSENNADSDEHEAITGGIDQEGKNEHCFVNTPNNRFDKTGSLQACPIRTEMEDIELSECGHLFPKINSYPGLEDEQVGDSHFGLKEEEFFRTNPYSNDTSGRGTMDEATVAGLGVMDFTWTYSYGDKIGVAVEGISVEPTTEKDTSYQTMWAITNNPDVIGIKSKKENFLLECYECDSYGLCISSSLDTFSSGFTISDINDVLEDYALVEPTTGTDYAKIETYLSVNDSNPQYDLSSEGGDSDTIVFRSSTSNNENNAFTNYKWELATASSPDATNWKQITQTELGDTVQLEGIGMDELELPLNSISQNTLGISSTTEQFYLRVTLKIQETTSEGVAKSGLETLIVPIQSSTGEIKIFSAETNSGTLQKGEEKCVEIAKGSSCPVTPYEIIALTVPSYTSDNYLLSWTLDGESLSSDDGGSTVYFPITKKIGSVMDVSVDIAGKNESTEKLSFSQSFLVSSPKATIVSSSENSFSPVVLGTYTDENTNTSSLDYSSDLFYITQGSTLQLTAKNNTSSIGKTTWTIDNEQLSAEDSSLSNDGKTISLNITKDLGKTYKISASTENKQSAATKKILYDKWGISSSKLPTEAISKSITAMVSSQTAEMATSNKKEKLLASLFSGAPDYILFLFKILLTFSLILLTSSLLLSFSPTKNRF